MNTRVRTAAIAAAVILAAGALYLAATLTHPATASSEPAAEVTMDNQVSFHPATVTIQKGQTVQWKNGGLIIHTVTADPDQAVRAADVHLPEGAQTFDSGDLQQGDSFRHTFDVPGEYVYFCVPHEADGMVGKVVVEP